LRPRFISTTDTHMYRGDDAFFVESIQEISRVPELSFFEYHIPKIVREAKTNHGTLLIT